ncbi:MAG: class SAM-dependent methyltransferase [Gammaproteobacteria bacterium]|jgi:trans-aconitate methyltransferase|nr:class SAM-dependent methyltransferase [Gammaproteobacteria bacterium]
MEKKDFDAYAKNYNAILSKQLNFFEKDNLYFAEYKIAKLKKIISFQPGHILDFGCGIGRSTLFLSKYFPHAQIYGCDISQESLLEAKKAVPSSNFFLTSALSERSKMFDVIFVSNVFHHVKPSERSKTLDIITQSSTSGGVLVVFEHNPYNPVTRHLVNTCPFDHDAVLLKPKELKGLFKKAGVQNIHLEYTLFFPAFFKRLRFLEEYLHFLPLGGQYVVTGNL